MASFYSLTAPHMQATNLLQDLWECEVQLAWQMDRWMLMHARQLMQIDSREYARLRRQSSVVRADMKRQLSNLGRPTMRLPQVVAHQQAADASRGLVGIYNLTKAALQLTRGAKLLADTYGYYDCQDLIEALEATMMERREFLTELSRSVFARPQRAAFTYAPTAA